MGGVSGGAARSERSGRRRRQRRSSTRSPAASTGRVGCDVAGSGEGSSLDHKGSRRSEVNAFKPQISGDTTRVCGAAPTVLPILIGEAEMAHGVVDRHSVSVPGSAPLSGRPSFTHMFLPPDGTILLDAEVERLAVRFMDMLKETKAAVCRLENVVLAAVAAGRAASDATATSEACKAVAAASGGCSPNGAAPSMPCKETDTTHEEVATGEACWPEVVVPSPPACRCGNWWCVDCQQLVQGGIDILPGTEQHQSCNLSLFRTMQVGSEEVKRNDDKVNGEELNASDDEVGVDIGGYAQDPNDDSDLQEIMQDPDGFEKSVKNLLDILQPDYPECLKRRKFI
uniref:Uncharacterized protein n=1 Tax=Leersia perrieri TaxID=77586 RepID=A0A0D9V6K1_9ORYZ